MIRSSLYDYFAKLTDPRLNRNKKHNLADIIVLSILAVICGAESWDSIEEFGKVRIDFLKKILHLPNGIPSHDTINRVFSMLRPDKFEVVFISLSLDNVRLMVNRMKLRPFLNYSKCLI